MFNTISTLASAVIQRIYHWNPKLYISFLRKQGVIIGKNTRFYGKVNIDYTRPCLVEIGRNCILADGVTVLTHGYDWSVLKEKYNEVLASSGKVSIGDNVFIGTNAIILKGVRIGNNVIIGAGSIVIHDIPADSVAAGNPCKIISSLDTYYEKRKTQYIQEAKTYAMEIYKKNNRIPVMEDFWEEFPIFLQREGDWGMLPVRSQLGPAYEKFVASNPKYKSLKEFLIDAGLPKEEVEKDCNC